MLPLPFEDDGASEVLSGYNKVVSEILSGYTLRAILRDVNLEKKAAAAVIIIAFVSTIIITNSFESQKLLKKTVNTAEDFIKDTFQESEPGQKTSEQAQIEKGESAESEEEKIEPPDIRVELSLDKNRYYLGDRPSGVITIKNFGGACELEYLIKDRKESGQGSIKLGADETEKLNFRKENTLNEIGTWQVSVDVTAKNESGANRDSDLTNFEVDVEPYNPDIGAEWYEESIVEWGEFWRGLAAGIWSWFDRPAEGYVKFFVASDSATIREVTEPLVNRHPRDRELQAKEIYYWVRDWISYDMDETYQLPGGFHIVKNVFNYSQIELPNETIWDRDGVCLNYSLVLASMYKVADFDVRLVILTNEGESAGHAINMLYLPNASDVRHSPGYPGWVTLDATNNEVFGEIYENWINSFDHAYIEDV